MTNEIQDVAVMARYLFGAMQRLERHRGRVVIVKYGGNAMSDAAARRSVAQDLTVMAQGGVCPVVVHGGGPQIGAMLDRLGRKSEFVDGMRVTDPETMDVVEMVLGGLVNGEIVSLINQAGGHAVGMTGRDGGLIRARRLRRTRPGGDEVDLGQVGEVVAIDTALIHVLTAAGYIPVVAPIGTGEDGTGYNINADLVAGALARALKAATLLMMTNIAGIRDKSGNRLASLQAKQVRALIDDGTVYGGMLPKVQSALDALEGGAQCVHIIDGTVEHALLTGVLFESEGGTRITADEC